MHSCTSVLGKIVLIASGNPFNPSTEAIKISCKPLLFKSVKTLSQKFAHLLSERYKPKISFLPSIFTPRTV